jgi:hypothetical protein
MVYASEGFVLSPGLLPERARTGWAALLGLAERFTHGQPIHYRPHQLLDHPVTRRAAQIGPARDTEST